MTRGRFTSRLAALALVQVSSVCLAQTTAPSGALAPSAPANVRPTTGGKNSGQPLERTGTLPQTPSPQPGGAAAVPAAGDLAAGAGSARGPSVGAAITLEEAIRRAQTVDHTYVSAFIDRGSAVASRTIARGALLPNVDYHNQVIYTQPRRPYAAAGSSNAPIFIANNSVREYISQGVVTETIGLGRVSELRRASAEAAAAEARLEIARRGLVATVVNAYYGVLLADEKVRVAAEALLEADRFLKLSGQLEAGGEVAHADVLKAQLQQAQRERESQDAVLTAERARLDLGVMLFPDPTVEYALALDLNHPPSLAARGDIEASAKNASPDVRAALASLQAAQFGLTASSSAYLPDISLAYNYGIDSDHFAVRDSNGVKNLGYAATATMDIPVFDWFATRARVRQSQLARDLAKADLTAAQRRMLAAFQEFYGEADVAGRQIVSLDRSVVQAREALRLTTLRYSSGEGSVLEAVDAQTTLVTALSSRADGVVRYYTALAALQTITGNLP